MFEHRIERFESLYLLGVSLEMNLLQDRTVELFKDFMPRRKDISSIDNLHVYLAKLYPQEYFKAFSPANTFRKFAGLKVEEVQNSPGFEQIYVSGGLYAIFKNTGGPNDSRIFQYIFNEWLPGSEYILDTRPHLDILPVGYWSSEDKTEDICIPVIKRI